MKNSLQSCFVVLALLALSFTFTNADSTKAQPRTIVRAGKLLDVKTGKIATDQAIVIDGDKIVSVGPASSVRVSATDHAINLPNATVLPGLIDAHTHLTFNPRFGYDTLAISIPREA